MTVNTLEKLRSVIYLLGIVMSLQVFSLVAAKNFSFEYFFSNIKMIFENMLFVSVWNTSWKVLVRARTILILCSFLCYILNNRMTRRFNWIHLNNFFLVILNGSIVWFSCLYWRNVFKWQVLKGLSHPCCISLNPLSPTVLKIEFSLLYVILIQTRLICRVGQLW